MNNIENYSEKEDLAWLAGFMNGDGHFTLIKQKMGKNRILYLPSCGVSNTDHSLIEESVDILNRLGIDHYVNSGKTTNGTVRTVRIKGFKRNKKFLNLILPEVRGKKKQQIELLLEWISSREKTGSNNTYTDRETEIYQQLLDLKKPD